MNKNMAVPNVALIQYLNSPFPAELEDLVFQNPCLRLISEGANGKTYTVGTAIQDGQCVEVVLVKVGIIENDRKKVVANMYQEGKLQNALYKLFVNADNEGFINSKRLIPAPIKQQDEYFFMQFIPDSETLDDYLSSDPSPVYFQSILFQIAAFFSIVETAYPDFRHRDLHFGNILITQPQLIQMTVFETRLTKVFVTIIDFGLGADDGEKPLDIMKILGLIAFDPEALSFQHKTYLQQFSDKIWQKVLLPLLSPFDFDTVLNYFENGLGQTSQTFVDNLEQKLRSAPLPFPPPIKFQSRQVLELMKTI